MSGEISPGGDLYEAVLRPYDEKRRAELVAAFMAVEHAAEPVPEVGFPALREPAERRVVEQMLALGGRTLIRSGTSWISGYRDDVARELAADPDCVPPEEDRAVLTLVLVHSVAIPRAEGMLADDTWLSPHPAPVEELRRRSQLTVGELESALRRLRAAGLVAHVRAGGTSADPSTETAGGYVPGPQFHRLTEAARRRLQEELILAAGPDSPLAAAVRARRRNRRTDRTDRADRPDRPDRAYRPDRPDRTDRTDQLDRTDQTDQTDQTDRTDQTGRAERAGRADGAGRADRRSKGDT